MHRINDSAFPRDLVETYPKLGCYPEVPEALSLLKRRGFRLAILSNGTPAMPEAAVKNADIDDLIEKNVSVLEAIFSE